MAILLCFTAWFTPQASTPYLSHATRKLNLERTKALLDIISTEAKGLRAEQQWVLALTVEQVAQERHLDPFILLAVIKVESHYRPWVVSNRGARGLMQVVPVTAEAVSRDHNLPWKGVTDLDEIEQNVKVGGAYLRMLLDQYDNNFQHALTAYNYGPSRTRKFLRDKVPLPKRYAQLVLQEYQHFKRKSYARANHFTTLPESITL